HLGDVARSHFVPRPEKSTDAKVREELHLPQAGPKPKGPATAGRHRAAANPDAPAPARRRRAARSRRRARITIHKERLFAHKPILDGWKLLEQTAVYRVAGHNPLLGSDGLTVGQILLMPKSALQRRVLTDPRIKIYSCGRRDVRTGVIDRRVLATLEFLAVS